MVRANKSPADPKDNQSKDAVANLNTAAQSGDQEAIKKAFGAAGAACKNCHDDFKKK